MIQRLKTMAATAILVAAFISVCSAQVTFRGFGVTFAYIEDMSADGSVAVGLFTDQARTQTAFRWTPGGGIEEIGGKMDAVFISRDGKTIVGAALDSQQIQSTAIWQSGKNWRVLGGVPGGVPSDSSGRLSHPSGVSGDGSVIVGSAYVTGSQTHAFRWDATSGMVDLGTMIKDEPSVANGVSANGNAIVGWTRDPSTVSRTGDGRAGVVYVGGIARLIHPYGWVGTAVAANNVGSTIVGRGNSYTSSLGQTTYRWNAWDGSIEDLGAVKTDIPTAYTSVPNALSDTGDVVVGVSGNLLRKAYIRTKTTGMVAITDFLTANGVTSHTGWDLRTAIYVSPDGKRIVGTGFNPQSLPEGWIVTLP